MGKIPEEAVKAAKDVLYYASPNDVERALAAAAPFLQGVKVKADPWVDTRLVSFDDTIAFGKGGFDFDRWESLRWEMHTRHGSFAVWKSDSKTWSMYGGKYGFLMLDRFSSEEEAKAEAEQLVISLDAEPSTRAQALEEAARAAEGTSPIFDHQSALGEYRDCESGFHNGRVAAAAAIRALSSPDHADAGKVEGDGRADLERFWRPISEADKSITFEHTFDLGDGEKMTIRNSDHYWVRDADGRVYEATWSDHKAGYWWDLEGESPVDPVEYMPHPLSLPSAPSQEVAGT